MDFITPIISILWNYISTKDNCAINMHSLDGEWVVNLIEGKHKKTFKNTDASILIDSMKNYLQVS